MLEMPHTVLSEHRLSTRERSPSRRQALRSQGKQRRKQRVASGMPGFSGQSSEPHGDEIAEREQPRNRYPGFVLEPHRKPPGSMTPSRVRKYLRSSRSPAEGLDEYVRTIAKHAVDSQSGKLPDLG